MTDRAHYVPGTLVRHPKKPEWGIGKVLGVKRRLLKIHFKDDTEAEFRQISLDHVPVSLAEEQSDPVLDNLPPFLGGRFDVKAKRVTFEDGTRRFNELFPRGFQDPDYLGGGAGKEAYGERNYKWAAHERYVAALGSELGEHLLREGRVAELSDRACTIVSKGLNLLSKFENMAFRDGLAANAAAAGRFFRSLFDFVSRGEPKEELFRNLADSLMGLPVDAGKAQVATWPVLTILPFLARPDAFMFLKPEPTKECADRLRFSLQYSPDLRWLTYRKLMDMSGDLLGRLRRLGARDYIDVQSFIWVIAKY